jgi:peptidoglycan lytic transglycosylase
MRISLSRSLVLFCVITGLGAAGQETSNFKIAAAQENGAISPALKAGSPVHPTKHHPRLYAVGLATWYGKVLHGHRTASGERFDMYQFTAAHRSLPFGSLVRVVNLKNGSSVVVRVNDRGILSSGRIIDLSYAAALALDMRSTGVARVRLEPAEPVTTAQAQKDVWWAANPTAISPAMR